MVHTYYLIYSHELLKDRGLFQEMHCEAISLLGEYQKVHKLYVTAYDVPRLYGLA